MRTLGAGCMGSNPSIGSSNGQTPVSSGFGIFLSFFI